MPRRVLPAVALIAAAAFPSGAAAQQGSQPQTPAQLFTRILLDDDKTTSTVKGLLTAKTGWVEPAPKFADLTGDGRADAVVRVLTGGVQGAVAVYVLSTDGLAEDAELRVVYRNQQLQRVVTRIDDAGALYLTVPVWSRGDDTSRASSYSERGYLWNAKARTFRRTATRTVGRPS